MESTSQILYSKLKIANASITIAEQRAEQAQIEAMRVTTTTSAQLEAMRSALHEAHAARRAAEQERDAALRPAPDEERRVRALEHVAHQAKRACDACALDFPDREALEEESRFRSAVARQARHFLAHGTTPPPAPVHAHFHLRPSDANAPERTSLALAARLDELVRDDRTFVGMMQRAAVMVEPTVSTAATTTAAGTRLNSFMANVCSDIKAGLAGATTEYDICMNTTAARMRAPYVGQP